MIRFAISLTLSGLVFFEFRVDAQIVKSASKRAHIDFSEFQVANDPVCREFLATLKNDLILSGYFNEAIRGRGDYKIVGSVANRERLEVALGVTSRLDPTRQYEGNYFHAAGNARGLAHRYADEILAKLRGVKGIASTRIALIGVVDGHKELFICDADGGNLQQYTRDRSISTSPKWGPSGERILYTSFRLRFPDVYEIDIRSGQRTRLARFAGLNTGATYAPNGRDIALVLSKDGNPEIYAMDRVTRKPQRLTRTASAAKSSPTWSPDGRRIAFVSDHAGKPDIYIVTRNTGALQRITTDGKENVQPAWGRNNVILYSSKQGSRYEIRAWQADTGRTVTVAADPGMDLASPSWAPNHRHVVLTGTVNYRSSVYILDTVERQLIPLIRDSRDWKAPSWSP